ncbi:hypothetical protein N7475_009454 [Penicillium sp. IBT 31633x]|nr:hypothetical protein N7475_009454 [Penicillium sp. IBT 31633x]
MDTLARGQSRHPFAPLISLSKSVSLQLDDMAVRFQTPHAWAGSCVSSNDETAKNYGEEVGLVGFGEENLDLT